VFSACGFNQSVQSIVSKSTIRRNNRVVKVSRVLNIILDIGNIPYRIESIRKVLENRVIIFGGGEVGKAKSIFVVFVIGDRAVAVFDAGALLLRRANGKAHSRKAE